MKSTVNALSSEELTLTVC